MVLEFKTCEEIENFIATTKGLIVLDFYADWCGPCKAIGKTIESWITAKKYPNVVFVKVNVDNDDLQSFVNNFNISSIPRIVGYKNNKSVFDMTGANVKGLEEFITQHKD